ncbi:ABC-2 type transport system ATP-binding protein [Ruminococcus sp. YE71]|uniref:ATP-binding cassette domain-containing protein n=1 Tax=unclassified Ruminococcus TaxID=2608920 RepID=UPI00088295E7|nr:MULTISPECIES: ATP-binding cassette domain-containing protein [unclassified Ruminococcus]SDA27697.1 ABC-2 type transport system ATP-binding protein [Ruminococcus sp. YE78]SFW45937.1 ABC-2 type transport system ATP-binding protein [Ruminococcus sp. YE71]
MRETILKTENLTKSYGKFTALDNADINVYRGDICGLIGRNGAGKTTFMKIVTGLTDQTSGSFQLFGNSGSTKFDKRRIGCLIENPAFFGSMTAFQNLKYYCLQKGIADMSKIDEVLALVNLTDARNKKFKTFSLGMKQRLGIAFAMLDDPDIVILDEPINGLDPIGISELRDTFKMLNRERGITFIISSHILTELYAVSDRFIFIDGGRILKDMTRQELDVECSRCTVVKCDDVKHASTIIDGMGITEYKIIDKNEIRIYQENVSVKELNKQLIKSGVDVDGINESGVSLEDYFKQLVGSGKD